ncbi:MAG: hypothetical protein IPK52_12725 [Chloroflexi bacterium]|nr:hypothetical protein [Chloroflexota bacterium]
MVEFDEEELEDDLEDEKPGKATRAVSYEPIRGQWDVSEMNFIPTEAGKSYIFPTRKRCPHCGSRGAPRL